MTLPLLRLFVLIGLTCLIIGFHWFFQTQENLFSLQTNRAQQQLATTQLELDKLNAVRSIKPLIAKQAYRFNTARPSTFVRQFSSFLGNQGAQNIKINHLGQTPMHHLKWKINYQIAIYSVQFQILAEKPLHGILEIVQENFPNLMSFQEIETIKQGKENQISMKIKMIETS